MKRSKPGSRWLAALALLSIWHTACADIEVVIEGVNDEIKRNLLVYLSLQRYRERDDLSADTIERLHERTPIEVRQALRPFGFYEPTVQSSVVSQGVAPSGHSFISMHSAGRSASVWPGHKMQSVGSSSQPGPLQTSDFTHWTQSAMVSGLPRSSTSQSGET